MSTDHEQLLTPVKQPAEPDRNHNALVALVIALDGIALVAAGQQVSLITGLGIFYLAAAIAVGALLVAFPLKAPVSVLFITWLVVIGCVANVVWANHKLDEKRGSITNDLNQIGTSLQQTPALPTIALPCSTDPGFGCDPNS